jgi:hypothetical protein
VVVISFLAVILDIPIIGLIVHVSDVGVLLFCMFACVSVDVLTSFALKVIPESWVLIKGDALELPIGVEAEDEREEVVGKADDGHCVDVLIFSAVGAGIDLVLDRRHKVDHEGHCKEDADEDVEHDSLVAALVLDDVEDEKEEQPEEGLQEELLEGHEVEDDHDSLRDHHHRKDGLEGLALLGGRYHLGSQAAQTHF